MTRILPALVTLALVLYPARVGASETREPDPCRDEPRPCFLRKGKPAPFDGELWPRAFAFAVLEDRANGMKAMGERDTARADLEAEKKGRAIDREEADKRLVAERKARASVEALARTLVEPPAWYESPGFLIPVTAVLTVGATVAVFFAAKEL